MVLAIKGRLCTIAFACASPMQQKKRQEKEKEKEYKFIQISKEKGRQRAQVRMCVGVRLGDVARRTVRFLRLATWYVLSVRLGEALVETMPR